MRSVRGPKSLEFTIASAYIELNESTEVQNVLKVLRGYKRLEKQQLLSHLSDSDPIKLASSLKDLVQQKIVITIDDGSGNCFYEINYARLFPVVKERLSLLAKQASEPVPVLAKTIDTNFKYRCKNSKSCGARFMAAEVDQIFRTSLAGFFCPRCNHEVGEAHPQQQQRMTERLSYYYSKILLADGNFKQSEEYEPFPGPAHVQVNLVTHLCSPARDFCEPIVSASDTPHHVPAAASLPLDCPYTVLGVNEPEPELSQGVISAQGSSEDPEEGCPTIKRPKQDTSESQKTQVGKPAAGTAPSKTKTRQKSNNKNCTPV